MTRDRLIQLVAALVAVLALAGSTLLINPINRQRRDLHLTFAIDSTADNPPQYALLAAGMGSFRGVAVNALWYRAEMMKREGQFAEANTLATWITYLQPRFPHVWGFLAWNMAYNISVETFTPQERYDWVNKGVKLLREKGIPYNPNSVRLYRELGWILFHKIGQSTDDVNWYYKGEFAREWEEILGAAPEQLNAAGIINEMGKIALYADRYFAVDGPSVRVKNGLSAVADAEAVPAITENLKELRNTGIVKLDKQLRDLRSGLHQADEDGIAALDALVQATADQLSRAERDATSVFLEENQRAALIVADLRSEGLQLDKTTLRAIGQCLMFLRFRSVEVVASLPETVMMPEAQTVLPLVFSSINAEPDSDLAIGFRDELLPFLRAKVLIEDYNMRPTVMYKYMAPKPDDAGPTDAGGYGPLDWRHPHTHSLYWSRLGVEQYYNLLDDDKVDILNTQRQALHSLQALSDAGTVSFNPFNRPGQQIDLLPDPDFIEGYFDIINETKAMADSEELGDRIGADAFAQGEENFLQKAVLYSYLYGSLRQAEKYYKRLIAEFADLPHNASSGEYDLPMNEYVAMLMFTDDLGRPGMIALINSRLTEGFRKGLAVGNQRAMNVFGRNAELAKTVHRIYNEQYGYETGLEVGGGRLRLPPFAQMVEDAFTHFMLNQRHDISVRISAYQTTLRRTDLELLAARTYRRWDAAVSQEITRLGVNPEVVIPVPRNVVETIEGIDQKQGGQTIERQ